MSKSIKIKSIDRLVEDNIIDNKPLSNNPLLWKHSVRWIVCGSSGSGKTTMVLQVVLNEFNYDRLYIVSRTLNHPKYQYLINKYDKLYDKEIKKELKEENISNEQINEIKNKIDKIAYFYHSAEELPEIDTMDPTLNNIVIFDDILLEKKSMPTIVQYFILGRNIGIKCAIFIGQNYYKVPRLIRENSNVLTFFKQMTDRSINTIYRDISTPFEKKEFKQIFKDNLKNKNDFVTFDLDTDDNDYFIRDKTFRPINYE